MTLLLGSLSSCCTEVGCNNAIVWQLPPTFPALAPTDAVRVRACAGSQCGEYDLVRVDGTREQRVPREYSGPGTVFLEPPQVRFSLFDADTSQPAAATLEVWRNGQSVITDSRRITWGNPSRPNGPLCDPTCWSARISL